MNLLSLDFETKDPYLSDERKLGPGWVYALNVQNSDFRVLGWSTQIVHVGENTGLPANVYYDMNTEQARRQLIYRIKSFDGIIAHNAQYELGCLLVLGMSMEDIKKIRVYDTKVISHLYDNRLDDTSLDGLSKTYLPSELQKKKHSLLEIMEMHRLGPLARLDRRGKKNEDLYPQLLEKKRQTRTYNQVMFKWAYQNMDVLQDKDLARFAYYCKQDTVSCSNLFLKFISRITLEQAEYWSSFNKILVDIRRKGVRVDLDLIRRSIPEMQKDIETCFRQIKELIGKEIELKQLDSPKQLSIILTGLGYRLPETDKGGDSTSSKWMEQQNDPLLDKIVEYRTLKLLLNSFLIKILDAQQYTCPEGMLERYGRVYPTYNIFGAETGRMSCNTPNLQQIPVRNKKWGKIIRAIFCVDDDTKYWYKADLSNQEGRIQVHYASLIRAHMADYMVDKFNKNKYLDLHQTVADLAGIGRSHAKTINLGISYGMGKEKLCKGMKISMEEAEVVLEKYHNALPYVKNLIKEAQNRLTNVGHITTLNNRKLYREHPVYKDGKRYTFDYKALNKLIQGSAADQMYMILKKAYESGINIRCIVHDEFNIEGDDEDMIRMKDIMENTLQLKVPMTIEVGKGKNWGELTKVEFETINTSK